MQNPLFEGRKTITESKNFLLREAKIILQKYKNAKDPDLKDYFRLQLNSIKGKIKSEITSYDKMITSCS